MEEICRGFNQVIEEGKAFYWATSNWSAENVYEAFEVCERLGLQRPVADQMQYNMLVRRDVEVNYETLFDRYGYGVTAWSPLAGGFLTGKYLDNIPEGSRYSLPSTSDSPRTPISARTSSRSSSTSPTTTNPPSRN